MDRDVFPFSGVLGAADRVREKCLTGGVGRRRVLGRDWVSRIQRVEVQFGSVFGSEVMERRMQVWNLGGDERVRGTGGEELTVMLTDGRNVSVVELEHALHGVRGCGGLLELGNGTAGIHE